MSIAKTLPLAFVMIAGPQILSAIFLATSERWKRDSAAFVGGAAISISLTVSIAFVLGVGATNQEKSNDTVTIIILALLIAAALHTFVNRNKQKDPPKWMGELETANAGLAFKLGFLLLGVFPTDILTSASVGGYLASQHEQIWGCIPFVGLTLLFLATPSLMIVLLGKRAKDFLPKLRDWMNDNSWVVGEIVLMLFIAMVASNL